MTNPLFDTLFRPTTGDVPDTRLSRQSAIASAPPVRAPGVHSRAGNAMSRTRAALLVGAARAVETTGTRFAMAQVASGAGVAKATLYNHFRTRDAVLEALIVDQVRRIADAQHGKPIDTALADAALAVSSSPVRHGLARVEPAALARLAVVDPAAEGWQLARAGVAGCLATAGFGGVDTVLRWLASFVMTPGTPPSIASDIAVLLSGLPVLAAAPRSTA